MAGHLDPQFMDVFTFQGNDSMPIAMQNDTLPLMPEFMEDSYPYGDQFFDYGPTAQSPLQSETFFSPPQVAWTHDAQEASGNSVAFLHARPSNIGGATPLTSGMTDFEPGIQYYTHQRQWEPSGSISPSQSSSVTGTLSSGTATYMDISTQTNTFDSKLGTAVVEPIPASTSAALHKTSRKTRDGENKGRKAATTKLTKDKRGTTNKVTIVTIPDASAAYPSPANTHKPSSPWTANNINAMPSEFATSATNVPAPQANHRADLVLPRSREPPTTTEILPPRSPPPPPPPKPDMQRQRNRKAATKCRAKTKQAAVELEQKERALASEHMELSTTVKQLREEVLALKSELLVHGKCDSEVIQEYLQKAAREIGAGSAKAASSPAVSRRTGRDSPP